MATIRRPQRGDRVVVPKGAAVSGTHRTHPKTAGRTYTVEVYSYWHLDNEVTWVGKGGYWHRTKDWRWPDGDSGRGSDDA
jgi:hypothetical protein